MGTPKTLREAINNTLENYGPCSNEYLTEHLLAAIRDRLAQDFQTAMIEIGMEAFPPKPFELILRDLWARIIAEQCETKEEGKNVTQSTSEETS